jgi:hypothetical protein
MACVPCQGLTIESGLQYIYIYIYTLLIKAARVVCHSMFCRHSCSATILILCSAFLILMCKENGPRAIWLIEFWCLMNNTIRELISFLVFVFVVHRMRRELDQGNEDAIPQKKT